MMGFNGSMSLPKIKQVKLYSPVCRTVRRQLGFSDSQEMAAEFV